MADSCHDDHMNWIRLRPFDTEERIFDMHADSYSMYHDALPPSLPPPLPPFIEFRT